MRKSGDVVHVSIQ